MKYVNIVCFDCVSNFCLEKDAGKKEVRNRFSFGKGKMFISLKMFKLWKFTFGQAYPFKKFWNGHIGHIGHIKVKNSKNYFKLGTLGAIKFKQSHYFKTGTLGTTGTLGITGTLGA